MSSNSSLAKPQLLSNSVAGAPRSIPYLRRFNNLFSNNGKIALLERSLAAIGMEWTSSEPLDEEPGIGLLKSSPRWPTRFPNIEGNGNGMGRGHRATDRWQNFGRVDECS